MKNTIARIIFIAALCFAALPLKAQDLTLMSDEAAAAKGMPAARAAAPAIEKQIPVVRGDFRDLKTTLQGERVTDVMDAVTLDLNNKTKVRLTGIWVPWDTPNDPGDNVRRATILLKKLCYGRSVRLYQTKNAQKGRKNRLGQLLAQVERDDGMWLQGALLYAGYATVMTTPSNPELAARMYALEADARKRKAGLWDDARWDVLPPDRAKDFINEYRIIEGKVFSTAMRSNMFFINFSRDWRTDFTIAVAATSRRAFSHAGIDLMGLNGHTVRVRGWVRAKNGPMIELTHPAQIEILD